MKYLSNDKSVLMISATLEFVFLTTTSESTMVVRKQLSSTLNPVRSAKDPLRQRIR